MILLLLASCSGPEEGPEPFGIAHQEAASAEWVVSLSLATLAGSCKEATAWDWLLVGVSEDGRTVESPVFWSPE